ncbi:MAG: GAF domain-containing protein, partial [Cyanobacteria bacterium J06576_12]
MAISVQRQEQQKLQGTDHGADAARSHALLTGVAKAAQRLLSIADFDAAVNEALAEIAQAAEIDRIYILENCLETETNRQSASMVYEWATSAPLRVLGSGGLTVYREDFEEQCAMNERGQPFQILARDLSEPARTIQNRYEAVSLLTVPIMCGEGWWGVIGFDDCTAERVWSSAEISVLETAAANFAAA